MMKRLIALLLLLAAPVFAQTSQPGVQRLTFKGGTAGGPGACGSGAINPGQAGNVQTCGNAPAVRTSCTQLVDGDSGSVLIYNVTGGCTLTIPAPSLSGQFAAHSWSALVININSSTVVFSFAAPPAQFGCTGGNSVSLAQWDSGGLWVADDGANYRCSKAHGS